MTVQADLSALGLGPLVRPVCGLPDLGQGCSSVEQLNGITFARPAAPEGLLCDSLMATLPAPPDDDAALVVLRVPAGGV